jgi:tRNA (guanine37-N1)-methyltransferase
MKKVVFITLFPEVIEPYLGASMMLKASKIAAVEFFTLNLRDFGSGPRKQVDDTPYGGGDGMVLKAEPIIAAIQKAKELAPNALVLLPTPRGKIYTQNQAKELASKDQDLIIICPRYEGYDERITSHIDLQFCIGSYVLTGGELPAMIMVDSVVRLLPGVLGGLESAQKESFQEDLNLIEHPHYTRPEVLNGVSVPDILLSGNHAQIEAWRQQNSKTQTPDC